MRRGGQRTGIMDFTPFYRTNIKKSVDEDRARIVAGFQDMIMSDSRVGLWLVNYYKGLPLSYPATLVEVHMGGVELDVHKQQAVALEKNGYTFIKCDYFPSAILAQVQNVNVRSMSASLRNFTYVQILAENRSALRLELEPQTDAEITWEGRVITGKVIEVSLGGLSVRTSEHYNVPAGVEVGLKVQVPNLLQNSQSKLDTIGTLVGITSQDTEDIWRFSIVSDQQSEVLLSRFIFQRQVEIIRELKELS